MGDQSKMSDSEGGGGIVCGLNVFYLWYRDHRFTISKDVKVYYSATWVAKSDAFFPEFNVNSLLKFAEEYTILA